MAFIAPFHGIRFNPDKVSSLEDVVTPPYDVIDARTQAAFEKRNPYNMIKLDIRKDPGVQAAAADRYSSAKKFFDAWQEEGVLVVDDRPGFYLYHIDYGLAGGRRFTRKGFISMVRLSEFAEGIVKPHEETFGTVTADRLRLMETCQAQFSQIFSLYSDPEGEAMELLEAARPKEPLCSVTDGNGDRHTLWRITQPEPLEQLARLFRAKSLYIADGHHRYSTALNFRRLMKERLGKMDDSSPYNHTMMYLCPIEDPGLSVLPTHRLVQMPGEQALDTLLAGLADSFVVDELTGGSREELMAQAISRMDECRATATSFGFYHAGEDRCVLLRLKAGEADRRLAAKPAALRDLDVVVLSDLVIGQHLGLNHERCENENLVHYYSDPDQALDEAVKRSVADPGSTPLLFLMNNTAVEQVCRVADEGLIMPHKSTFFYPKILTGLVLSRFNPRERMGI